MTNERPDTKLVSTVIADRFPKFLSLLTGTTEDVLRFTTTEVSVEHRDGIFWLELAITRFSDIKDLFRSYSVAVRSWMQNP
jgi:hypothetical protein